ncbi:FAD/NAD(P)-binding protein [Jonesia quinghaiensis]|uniref:FAD/NAD(P)-binding protein n=1 Tax=Jonesia quinghaiensis TaxID=262806 RepID=UPI0004900AB1|nr:FAD/NAD(P)-binding protein [Jonesia quinghaiensis]
MTEGSTSVMDSAVWSAAAASSPADASPSVTWRVAVVGGGPKGVAALCELESVLTARSDTVGGASLQITVFDPYAPGSGAVWDPETPEHLLMNVSPTIVDLSAPSFPLSYSQWAQWHPNDDARAQYPPRARMGEYLHAAWGGLAASPTYQVTHQPVRVTSVHQENSSEQHTTWNVTDEHGTTHSGFDVVLLATGHRSPVSVADHQAVADSPATNVTIRGTALTGIDNVLTLTQGRGGAWENTTSTPEGLTYVPSGNEPQNITLLSRTGLPMSPKPPALTPQDTDIILSATVRLRHLDPTGDGLPDSRWWDTLVDAATAFAIHRDATCDRAGLRAALTSPDSLETPTPDAEENTPTGVEGPRDVTAAALDRMLTHLAMNAGDIPPDARWVWGRVWHVGYRDIIGSLELEPRQADAWQEFQRFAAVAERWAYGPPEQTVRKLIALTRSGVLTWKTTALGAVGHEAVDHETTNREPGKLETSTQGDDSVINAITSPPGVLLAPRPWVEVIDPTAGKALAPNSAPLPITATVDVASRTPDPLWHELLANGHVTVRHGERGVLTDHATRCIGANGVPTPGLFALGRPTEDPVIGHDTLNHRLHGQCEAWATYVVEQLVREQAAAQ